MHRSALTNGKLFFEHYAGAFESATVVDIGAQNVNGSLRDICPSHLRYIGVDFIAANGVDVVLDDPYKLPFDDESVDCVVSTSCFEHSEMFWILFLEILRILKPKGLFYLNAPSNGAFHRFPVDCWRFYPDSGSALVTWGCRNGYDPIMLESFVTPQDRDVWNDFIAVFIKDKQFAETYPKRIVDSIVNFNNGIVMNRNGVLNVSVYPEDVQKLIAINNIVIGETKV